MGIGEQNGVRYEMLPDGGIQLSSKKLLIKLFPEFGGIVTSLRSNYGSMKEWLWTDPTRPLYRMHAGGSYDANFHGGIDQLFPNDYPTTVNGIDLPDHGELWFRSWEWRIVPLSDGYAVEMNLQLQTVPVHATRTIILKENELILDNRFRNLSTQTVPYLWVIHPALAIGPSYRFHFPTGQTIVDDELNGRIAKGTKPFTWPGHELGVNLSFIPRPDNSYESYYITNLEKGVCYVEDSEIQQALQINFPLEQFPHLWLFMPLGGWRNYYFAVVEPSSGYPTDLADAIQNGTHSELKPHEEIEAAIAFSVVDSKEIQL